MDNGASRAAERLRAIFTWQGEFYKNVAQFQVPSRQVKRALLRKTQKPFWPKLLAKREQDRQAAYEAYLERVRLAELEAAAKAEAEKNAPTITTTGADTLIIGSDATAKVAA